MINCIGVWSWFDTADMMWAKFMLTCLTNLHHIKPEYGDIQRHNNALLLFPSIITVDDLSHVWILTRNEGKRTMHAYVLDEFPFPARACFKSNNANKLMQCIVDQYTSFERIRKILCFLECLNKKKILWTKRKVDSNILFSFLWETSQSDNITL